jgi:hypothetical protein
VVVDGEVKEVGRESVNRIEELRVPDDAEGDRLVLIVGGTRWLESMEGEAKGEEELAPPNSFFHFFVGLEEEGEGSLLLMAILGRRPVVEPAGESSFPLPSSSDETSSASSPSMIVAVRIIETPPPVLGLGSGLALRLRRG